MALLRDYEVPNTGLTVTGAYHVISSIKLDKRTTDVPDPVGSETSVRDSSNAIHWEAGYVAVVTVDVYATEAARTGGKVAVGKIGPVTEYTFMFDTTSSDGIMEQAYAYLKTTTYYSTASDT